MSLFIPGQKVTLKPMTSSKPGEKGIVKSMCADLNYVFVVYNCDNNWDDYENYTAARTYACDLRYGWPDDHTKNEVVEEITKLIY